MAVTHFSGPVDSTAGFTINGIPTTSLGTAQPLADNTGDTPTDAVEEVHCVVSTVAPSLTGSDTINKTNLSATITTIISDLHSIENALLVVNTNFSSVVAALNAAGVVT